MPRESMNERQVSAYLHMDIREIRKLASRDQIPSRRVGGEFQFLKGEIDHWIERQMHLLGPNQLAGIERGVSLHHGFDHEAMLVCRLIPPRGLAVPLVAKTREAVLRRLIDIADQAELVYARDELLDEVRQRENLCSTALIPGIALPHPHHPLPYDIAKSFVVVGLTSSGVPFGAEDGSLTRLFFLICCKDDRTHLHVLARLGRMFHEKGAVEDLLAAEDEEELGGLIEALEESVI